MYYFVLALLCSIGCLVGLFTFAFLKGRRKKGGISAIGLFLGAVVFAILGAEQDATQAGWKSALDKQNAAEAGITDPRIYELKKAEIEANIKSKADATEAEKTDAENKKRDEEAKEATFYSLPADQAAVIAAVNTAKEKYAQVDNDLAKGGVRRERAREICKAASPGTIKGWIGTLSELDTNSEGLGVVQISISENVTVRTMNNAFSDIGSDTLIDPDSDLFKKLSALTEGQKVKFSGTLVSPMKDVDCLFEISLTMDGAMNDPEFIIRLSDVETYQ